MSEKDLEKLENSSVSNRSGNIDETKKEKQKKKSVLSNIISIIIL